MQPIYVVVMRTHNLIDGTVTEDETVRLSWNKSSSKGYATRFNNREKDAIRHAMQNGYQRKSRTEWEVREVVAGVTFSGVPTLVLMPI